MKGSLSPADYLTGRAVASVWSRVVEVVPFIGSLSRALYRIESLHAPEHHMTVAIRDKTDALCIGAAHRFCPTAHTSY